jgi:hypothetical protein
VYNIDEEYENPRLIYYRRGKIKKLGGNIMKKILMFLCVVCFAVSSACLLSCQNKIDTELFYVDMGTPYPIQGLVEYYGVKEGFPRILRKNVDDAIGRVKYTIHLNSIADYKED